MKLSGQKTPFCEELFLFTEVSGLKYSDKPDVQNLFLGVDPKFLGKILFLHWKSFFYWKFYATTFGPKPLWLAMSLFRVLDICRRMSVLLILQYPYILHNFFTSFYKTVESVVKKRSVKAKIWVRRTIRTSKTQTYSTTSDVEAVPCRGLPGSQFPSSECPKKYVWWKCKIKATTGRSKKSQQLTICK